MNSTGSPSPSPSGPNTARRLSVITPLLRAVPASPSGSIGSLSLSTAANNNNNAASSPHSITGSHSPRHNANNHFRRSSTVSQSGHNHSNHSHSSKLSAPHYRRSSVAHSNSIIIAENGSINTTNTAAADDSDSDDNNPPLSARSNHSSTGDSGHHSNKPPINRRRSVIPKFNTVNLSTPSKSAIKGRMNSIIHNQSNPTANNTNNNTNSTISRKHLRRSSLSMAQSIDDDIDLLDDRIFSYKRTLSKLPEDRSSWELQKLFDWINSLNISFYNKLTADTVRLLCRLLTIRSISANEYIFKQNDNASEFFVLITGKVSILVDSVTAHSATAAAASIAATSSEATATNNTNTVKSPVLDRLSSPAAAAANSPRSSGSAVPAAASSPNAAIVHRPLHRHGRTASIVSGSLIHTTVARTNSTPQAAAALRRASSVLYSNQCTVCKRWGHSSEKCPTTIANNAVLMEVGQLTAVAAFGEVAVLTNDSTRAASVRAITNCELLVLSKSSYDDSVQQVQQSAHTDRLELIRSVFLFGRFSFEKLLQFSIPLKEINLNANKLIYSQGDSSESVYFIKSGTVRLQFQARTNNIKQHTELFQGKSIIEALDPVQQQQSSKSNNNNNNNDSDNTTTNNPIINKSIRNNPDFLALDSTHTLLTDSNNSELVHLSKRKSIQFRYYLSHSNIQLRIQVKVLKGELDIFIDTHTAYPNKQHHTWSSLNQSINSQQHQQHHHHHHKTSAEVSFIDQAAATMNIDPNTVNNPTNPSISAITSNSRTQSVHTITIDSSDLNFRVGWYYITLQSYNQRSEAELTLAVRELHIQHWASGSLKSPESIYPLCELDANQLFGAVEILTNNNNRISTAITTTQCKLYKLPAEHFLRHIRGKMLKELKLFLQQQLLLQVNTLSKQIELKLITERETIANTAANSNKSNNNKLSHNRTIIAGKQYQRPRTAAAAAANQAESELILIGNTNTIHHRPNTSTGARTNNNNNNNNNPIRTNPDHSGLIAEILTDWQLSHPDERRLLLPGENYSTKLWRPDGHKKLIINNGNNNNNNNSPVTVNTSNIRPQSAIPDSTAALIPIDNNTALTVSIRPLTADIMLSRTARRTAELKQKLQSEIIHHNNQIIPSKTSKLSIKSTAIIKNKTYSATAAALIGNRGLGSIWQLERNQKILESLPPSAANSIDPSNSTVIPHYAPQLSMNLDQLTTDPCWEILNQYLLQTEEQNNNNNRAKSQSIKSTRPNTADSTVVINERSIEAILANQSTNNNSLTVEEKQNEPQQQQHQHQQQPLWSGYAISTIIPPSLRLYGSAGTKPNSANQTARLNSKESVPQSDSTIFQLTQVQTETGTGTETGLDPEEQRLIALINEMEHDSDTESIEDNHQQQSQPPPSQPQLLLTSESYERLQVREFLSKQRESLTIGQKISMGRSELSRAESELSNRTVSRELYSNRTRILLNKKNNSIRRNNAELIPSIPTFRPKPPIKPKSRDLLINNSNNNSRPSTAALNGYLPLNEYSGAPTKINPSQQSSSRSKQRVFATTGRRSDFSIAQQFKLIQQQLQTEQINKSSNQSRNKKSKTKSKSSAAATASAPVAPVLSIDPSAVSDDNDDGDEDFEIIDLSATAAAELSKTEFPLQPAAAAVPWDIDPDDYISIDNHQSQSKLSTTATITDNNLTTDLTSFSRSIYTAPV